MVSCGRSSQKEGYPGATTTATTMARATTVLLMYYAALKRAGAGSRRPQEAPDTQFHPLPGPCGDTIQSFSREREREREREKEREKGANKNHVTYT